LHPDGSEGLEKGERGSPRTIAPKKGEEKERIGKGEGRKQGKKDGDYALNFKKERGERRINSAFHKKRKGLEKRGGGKNESYLITKERKSLTFCAAKGRKKKKKRVKDPEEGERGLLRVLLDDGEKKKKRTPLTR